MNNHAIILDDVTVKVKDKVILNHLSVTFDHGSFVGISGANASGKSMLF